MIRVGINGFGRMGKMILKAIITRDLHDQKIEVAAISGTFDAYITPAGTDDKKKGKGIIINGSEISIIPASPDPALLPWREYDIDHVIDTTGIFTSYEKARGHLIAGAKK